MSPVAAVTTKTTTYVLNAHKAIVLAAKMTKDHVLVICIAVHMPHGITNIRRKVFLGHRSLPGKGECKLPPSLVIALTNYDLKLDPARLEGLDTRIS